jgi:arylsulfatase A-like enzyme
VTLPGKKNAGTVLPQLISNGVDFFASVCDWAGVELPAGAKGKSFRGLVESGDSRKPHQDYIITETRFDGSKTRGWVVRSERYKYVLYDKGRYREQLFDMLRDRGEMRNLAVENAYADQLQTMRDILENWMDTNGIRPTRPKLHDVPGKQLKKRN